MKIYFFSPKIVIPDVKKIKPKNTGTSASFIYLFIYLFLIRDAHLKNCKITSLFTMTFEAYPIE